MNKLLSVVIPVYKVEKYIRKCLDSLLVKDEKLFNLLDVVVVNDGTPDRSAEFAREYEIKFPNVFRVIDQENRGHGGAWNHGTELAVGKYLFYLDSDDWFDTEQFERLIKYLETADTDMVMLDGQKYYAETNTYVERTPHLSTLEAERIYKTDEFDWHGCGIGYAMSYAHDTVYRTSMMQKYLPLFCEHVMYDDVSLQVIPIVIAKDFIYTHLDVYRYYIGRPGQSFDPKVRALRGADDITKVIKFCLEWITKHRAEIPKGGKREEWLEDNYQSMPTWHYYDLSTYDLDISEQRLSYWDGYIQSNYSDIKPNIFVKKYRSLSFNSYITWFRRYKFLMRVNRYLKRQFMRPIKAVRNLFWDIQFRWHEFKIGMKEGREADRIEQESANPMAGLIYYKQCEVERAERKRLHQLRKQK